MPGSSEDAGDPGARPSTTGNVAQCSPLRFNNRKVVASGIPLTIRRVLKECGYCYVSNFVYVISSCGDARRIKEQRPPHLSRVVGEAPLHLN